MLFKVIDKKIEREEENHKNFMLNTETITKPAANNEKIHFISIHFISNIYQANRIRSTIN